MPRLQCSDCKPNRQCGTCESHRTPATKEPGKPSAYVCAVCHGETPSQRATRYAMMDQARKDKMRGGWCGPFKTRGGAPSPLFATLLDKKA